MYILMIRIQKMCIRDRDTTHSVRQRKGQLVRLGIAQADRQASLRVSVNQQDFLSGLRQTDSKIGTGGGLSLIHI